MARRAPIYKQRRTWLTIILFVAGLLVVLGTGTIIFLPGSILNSSTQKKATPVVLHRATPAPKAATSAIKVMQSSGSNKELIGISDGSYAFDTNRSDGGLKSQGAQSFKNGDSIGARAEWLQATAQDASDAETLIYLEDLQIKGTSTNYVTLIVGTALTGNDYEVGAGKDALQGAYVAQKEYNDGAKLSGGKQVCLLIANAGSVVDDTTKIAQQIVQAVSQDQTIVGVLGWPDSARTQKAIAILSKASIPLVSQTASADELTGVSPFFFRVAPSNTNQAIEGAKYATQQLNAKRIALFFDQNNLDSSSLANDFKQKIPANQIVDIEQYTVGESQTLPGPLNAALAKNPDLIYFSGNSNDLATLLTNIPTSQPNLQIMGGNALYQLRGYPSSARAGFSRLHFTSFFYPDEWGILEPNAQKPAFFSEYASNFDPGNKHPNVYGLSRADSDVALAYDATTAILQGCQNALKTGSTLITTDALRQGLAQITGNQAFQGVSGQIAFDKNGDSVNKAIVILYVDQQGDIQMAGKQNTGGCFQLAAC